MADQPLNPTLVPNEADRIATRAQNFAPATPTGFVTGHDKSIDEPDALDAARATWSRETIVGNILRKYAIDSTIDGDASLRGEWNPYSYFARNKEALADLEGYVGRGDFDGINSETDFKRKAEFIRQSKADLETMQHGGFLGATLGLGASLLDVTTLMPGAVYGRALKGGSRLANAMRLGGVMAGEQSVQELALQDLDPTRTAEESFMNIGLATGLGGALGSLAKGLHPQHKLNPDHPDNPLNPANFARDREVIEHRIGQTPEEGAVFGVDSVGAARVVDQTNGFAQGEGIGGKVQGVAESMLGHGTPLGRMRGYAGVGFDYLTKLVDMGGRLTRGMVKGDALTPDAESLRQVYVQHARAAQEDIRGIFRQAQLDMGQSALETGAKTGLTTITLGAVDRNAIPKDVFFDGVFRRMSADMLEGNGHTGHRADAAKAFKGGLVERGFTEAQAAQAHTRVEQAAKRTKELFDKFFGDAVRSGLIDPKDAPKAGGYGLPVLYVRSAINDAPKDMENSVLRLLANRPPDDWLEAQGLGKWAEIEAAGDTVAINNTLRQWRGETEDAVRAAAASALMHADSKLRSVKDEFDTIYRHGLPAADRQRKTRSVAAIRAAVRSSEADHYGRAMGWHMNRIEKAETRLAEIDRDYPDLMGLGEDVQREFGQTGEKIDKVIAGFPTVVERRATLAEQLRTLRDERRAIKDVATSPVDKGQAQFDEIFGKWEGQAQHSDGVLHRIRGEREALIAERVKATQELNVLRKQLDESARGQRRVGKWLDAVANKIEEARGSKELAADRPGVAQMIDDSAERIRQLKQKSAEAEQARRWAVQEWLAVRKGAQVSRAELREARKDAGKAARLHKRVQGRTPLVEYTEKLVSSLRGHERAPRGLLMDEVPDSSRVKERKFQWTPELWNELAQKGMVETDPVTLLDRYARDMGGRLAVHKAMGGRTRSSVLAEVRQHYDDLIEKSRSEKRTAKLRDAQENNLKDIETTWDRLLGHADIEDDNAVTWFAEKLRQSGFIRMAGGFIFSAMGDLATAMFAAPGFVRGIRKQHLNYSALVKQALAGNESARELRAMLASMETGAHMATSVNALGGGSTRAALGFGTGTTRKLTGQIDRVMDMVGDKVNVLSGLAHFSDAVRRTAGLVQLDNIVRMVGKFEKLSKSQQGDLVTIGIGRHEASRMATLFEKYGERVGELFNPGISKWRLEDDGDALAEVLNAALVKTQNRASYTQGFGNMPRLMDKTIGKLFFQFQSFAFQFTNNFVLTGIQRGAVTDDWMRFAHVLGVSLSSAVLVSTARAQLRGEDPTTWSNAKWAKEVVDRSGLLGWLSPYVDGATKLIGPTVNNVAGANILEPSSRFRENGVLESFLGPWAQQLKHLSGMAGDGARHDWPALREKAARLVPLNQQINAMRYIAVGIQGD